MFIADKWKEYRLLDCSCGERLEQWGDYRLIRPDPQAVWKTPKDAALWNSADARYIRSSSGGGHWDFKREIKDFVISYEGLKFNIRPTNFKHTGLFPEQASNWDWIKEKISGAGRPVKVLVLFGYTGAATLAAASAGASVCHVDASKGIVEWCRENAAVSGLKDAPIRYIVDDCEKFVLREIRRQNRYDGIIMDPPSYGRGPKGEIWKFEDKIYDFTKTVSEVLSDNPLFFITSSYTSGLSYSVMDYICSEVMSKKFRGRTESGDLFIPVESTGLNLPCGHCTRWYTE